MAHRASLTALGVLLAAFVPAAHVSGEEVYLGSVTVSTNGKPATVALTLTIREYTSDERTFALAETLHKTGHAAAVKDMGKGEAGSVRLGDKATFRASVIRFQKTDTGRVVRVVTDRPMQLADVPPGAPAGDAVGYLELTLGSAGEGKGRLIPSARIVFDSEGFLAPESSGPEWPVSSVTPKK